MKSASALTLLFSLAIVPGVALAELVASLDFTGGAGAWTIQVTNPGDPSPYPVTYELDGDPTKYGYEENTVDTAYVQMYQVVSAPVGFTMSNIQVDAKVSGYSSWNMLGRFGLGLNPDFCTACAPYWTGSDHGGASHVDLPLTLDASGDANFTDVSSVVILTEVWKGLNGFWLPVNVSDIKVYADVIPEPSSIALMAIGALAFVRRRLR